MQSFLVNHTLAEKITVTAIKDSNIATGQEEMQYSEKCAQGAQATAEQNQSHHSREHRVVWSLPRAYTEKCLATVFYGILAEKLSRQVIPPSQEGNLLHFGVKPSLSCSQETPIPPETHRTEQHLCETEKDYFSSSLFTFFVIAELLFQVETEDARERPT